MQHDYICDGIMHPSHQELTSLRDHHQYEGKDARGEVCIRTSEPEPETPLSSFRYSVVGYREYKAQRRRHTSRS
jgi:hypothetical protein